MTKNQKENLYTVLAFMGIFIFMNTFAYGAGLETLKTTMQGFANTIIGIASTIIVVAIIWAGFKVAFGAGWADVSNVVMGSLIIGSAGVIAGLLLGDSGVEAVPGVK
ncbi:MAG: TrbC/VirB2 family protein [Sulfurovum sp.]|nr:TrbC/VirB2 family protein [Sulfurovum sp.]